MTIRKITASKMSLFENLEIEFSNGCNLFIGENATGKTQLLKILNEA